MNTAEIYPLVPGRRLVTALAITAALTPFMRASDAEATPTTQAGNIHCVEPTKADSQAVEHLLAKPESQVLYGPTLITNTAPPDGTTHGGGDSSGASDQQILDAERYRKDKAAEYGLTIFDGAPFEQRLSQYQNQEYSAPGSIPFAQYHTVAQQFMSKYGVKIKIAQPGAQYSYGAQVPTATDLESENAKATVHNIVSAYSNVPKQYVSESGLKYIVLVTGMGESAGAYAKTTEKHNTYYVNIGKNQGSVLPPREFQHENMHLRHAAQCGTVAMSADKRFSALNGRSNIYLHGKYDTVHTSLIDYKEITSNEAEQKQRAFAVGDTDTYCAIVNKEQTLASKILTYSRYHPNVVEDVAELGAEMSNPYTYAELTDSRFVKLRRKFLYLLAREYHSSPNVVKYFIDTAKRPPKDGQEQTC